MSLQSREVSMKACMRCSNCRWLPSINQGSFAHICPSIRYGKFHSYSGGGKMITGYGLLHGAIDYDAKILDTIFSCSACGGCDVACASNLDDTVEPMEGIYALRQRVVEDGKLPPSLQVLLDNLKVHGSACGKAAGRGAWCRGLPQASDNNADLLLVVGDAAFDEAQWPQLRGMVEMLDAARADYAIAGLDEVDCGGLAFELGDKALAISLAERFVDLIRTKGARRILTQDDALFAALRNFYPRLGVELGNVEILHVSQWMAENAAPKAVKSETVTYHDTCRLGRLSESYVPWSGEHELAFGNIVVRTEEVPTRFGNGGVYDEPRQVIEATGARIAEMPRIRETSYCCGLGAGAKDFNPEFAASAARDRLTEALSTGARTMVTSCADCACHLQEVADHEGMDIKVTSLLDFTQKAGA